MLRCAITDRSQTNGSLAELLQACVSIAPHVDLLQVRERDISALELERFCAGLASSLGERAPLILVNHRADVALAAGVHGVHLRSSEGELTPAQVRLAWARAGRARPAVSVSAHSLEEAAAAAKNGADYILFGPVFGKTVHVEQITAPAGLDALNQAVAAAAGVPVLALGGVTQHNADACMAAGAAGIAGIRMFFQSPMTRVGP